MVNSAAPREPAMELDVEDAEQRAGPEACDVKMAGQLAERCLNPNSEVLGLDVLTDELGGLCWKDLEG